MMVDAFIKFVLVEPVKMVQSRAVVKSLQDLMCVFGVPTRIISDRESAFTFHKLFSRTYSIKHVLNAVATPSANRQCERYNKTIVTALSTRSADDDRSNWDLYVKEVQTSMNTMYNKGIDRTAPRLKHCLVASLVD